MDIQAVKAFELSKYLNCQVIWAVEAVKLSRKFLSRHLSCQGS